MATGCDSWRRRVMSDDFGVTENGDGRMEHHGGSEIQQGSDARTMAFTKRTGASVDHEGPRINLRITLDQHHHANKIEAYQNFSAVHRLRCD